MSAPDKRRLEGIFRAAVAAADPRRLVREALRCRPEGILFAGGGVTALVGREDIGRIFLAGGGKAGRTMGEAAAEALAEGAASGALAVPRGRGGAAGAVRFIEAGHPLPDDGSREAARAILDILASAGERDLVIALISGGGSAMIAAPPAGVSPADMDAVFRRLLRSGADIAEINTVRKHLSLVAGGRLARAAFPARVFALLLSDVPGDDPSVIASGPFSPDPTTYADAMDVLVRRGILEEIPAAARAHIESGAAGAVPETPKPGDPVFARVHGAVIGSNRVALEAAAAAAGRDETNEVRLLPGFLRGEARECARAFVAELRQASASVPPWRAAVLIAGGETTVTLRGNGTGGRNQEFALAAAIALDGEEGMAVLSAGTDGVDGPTDAAGAVADGSTCSRAGAAGLSPSDRLENNDAFPVFRRLSDLVVIGATGTNVADIAIGVAAPRGRGRARRAF